MKRTAIFILLFLLCTGLALNVSAASSAQTVHCDAVVDSDSSCTVTITATLVYQNDDPSPVFPVPKDAEDVTLSGSPATVFSAANSRMVSLKDITGGKAGTYSITIHYRLSAVVSSSEEEGMLLDLQLLAGFPYPISSFSATVTLPGPSKAEPQLISGYYQQDVGELLRISHEDSQIKITSLQTLKDNETLSLWLPVDGNLFPQAERTARVMGLMDLMIVLAMGVSVIFYLLTMRPTLHRQTPRASAPDGVTAGETSLWYTGTGVDLSMLVVTWAQLGYIRIQVEDGGRVLLHKRMDMGNERSAYENKCYKELFGHRRIIDGTSYRYAELCRRMAKSTPRLKDVYRPTSGNPYLFRGMCALSGLFSGIAMAGAFAPYSTALQIILATVLTLLSLALQSGGRCLFLRRRSPAKIAIGCALIWLVLGLFSGEWINALLQILFQPLAGMALAYGGRRTELGQQALDQIRGLRKHMRSVSKQELQRLLKTNPNYFYDLAPYALALGLDKAFARRFGRLRMSECTYLIRNGSGLMTAAEWAAQLRTTVEQLDARSKRLLWEKLTGRR